MHSIVQDLILLALWWGFRGGTPPLNFSFLCGARRSQAPHKMKEI